MNERAPAGRLLTAEEFARLPDDPYWRDELSRGRLVREPRPGSPHARVQAGLARVLGGYVVRHRLGFVQTEGGFTLERDPDTVRGPDVAFVSRDRYGDVLPEHWPEYGPDLVVEVLSPSDRPGRMARKLAQYFGAGTRLVWVIDPKKRTATVYRPSREVRVLQDCEELDGEDVLPGFRCGLAEVLD